MLCKHYRRLFISRETRTSANADPYRASAFVCPECGEFHVWINGVDMTFTLVTDEQVEAAGMYAKMLKGEDEPCQMTSSATPPSPASSSLPASTSGLPSAPEWLTDLWRQTDGSAEAFETEL